MLLLAWDAFTTVPSAERLAESRMAAIPTLTTMLWMAARSAMEVAVLMVLLWPWNARRYATRAFICALVLPAYFLFTTPLSLTSVHWVHRRWLAGLEVLLLVVWATAALARTRRSHDEPAEPAEP